MSIRFIGHGRRKLRAAALASVVCTTALVLSGCFTATTQFAVITSDAPGALYTVKKVYTDAVIAHRNSPHCNIDANGNGAGGGPQDRAWCAFDFIRDLACDSLSGSQRSMCYSVTNRFEEWEDFNGAVSAVMGADDCLAVHYGSTVSPPFNWTARRLGTGGCIRGG